MQKEISINLEYLMDKIKQLKIEVSRVDYQLTGEFICIETRIRNDIINNLKDKMLELESSLQELNKQKTTETIVT